MSEVETRALADHHAQYDGRWFPVWVGFSPGSFYLGVSLMPESGLTVGLGFVYFGVGRYDRD